MAYIRENYAPVQVGPVATSEDIEREVDIKLARMKKQKYLNTSKFDRNYPKNEKKDMGVELSKILFIYNSILPPNSVVTFRVTNADNVTKELSFPKFKRRFRTENELTTEEGYSQLRDLLKPFEHHNAREFNIDWHNGFGGNSVIFTLCE